MKCIYTKKTLDSGAKFLKREHIFPAGIGGVNKLNFGVVSDEVNEMFSKLELDFIRNSPILLPRNFYGPGKRGSLSQNKRTKSKISVLKNDEGNLRLGYISLGIPYVISNIYLDCKKIKSSGEKKISLSLSPQENNIIETLKK